MILEVFDYEPDLSPISVFKAVRNQLEAPCALLESAMTDDKNQFSLIAACPIQEVVSHNDTFKKIRAGIQQSKAFPKHFPFSGGLIGYFNFEIFDEIERRSRIKSNPEQASYPHAIFYEFSRFFAFDHAQQKIFSICTTSTTPTEKALLVEENHEILKKARRVQEPNIDLEALKTDQYLDFSIFESQQNQTEFETKVLAAKQKILDGEIFQIIISNGFKKDVGARDGIEFYEVIRQVEPTTHLFFLDFEEHGQVCGASPEILGSKRGKDLTYSPIAGTRYRGQNETEDKANFEELRTDPKENAEHDMLVDLGRNDLGKICEPKSIKIEKEKYGRFFANVMHLVSDITGQMRSEFDAVDFFKAIHPAGTLTGAPKIRAIDLIREFEQLDRNLYGGAVGYFSADGDMEFCIAIRSFFLKDKVARFRTGAGVVQDSIPEQEWLEVHNKARTLCKIFNYVLTK